MRHERLKASVERASADTAKRTIDVLFYSGASVQRYDWWNDEEYLLSFSMQPSHVRLARLNSGAPLLNAHNDFQLQAVIGVVENARVEGGKGYATVRFSEREEVTPIWNDVQSGILQNVSMGAAIYDRKDVTPKGDKMRHWLATDWEPMEISAVPVGADPEAGFLAFESRSAYLEAHRKRSPFGVPAESITEVTVHASNMSEILGALGKFTLVDEKPKPRPDADKIRIKIALREAAFRCQR